jgi:hypothetical protein
MQQRPPPWPLQPAPACAPGLSQGRRILCLLLLRQVQLARQQAGIGGRNGEASVQALSVCPAIGAFTVNLGPRHTRHALARPRVNTHRMRAWPA